MHLKLNTTHATIENFDSIYIETFIIKIVDKKVFIYTLKLCFHKLLIIKEP